MNTISTSTKRKKGLRKHKPTLLESLPVLGACGLVLWGTWVKFKELVDEFGIQQKTVTTLVEPVKTDGNMPITSGTTACKICEILKEVKK